MKLLKRTLIALGVVFLAVLFAALIFRIALSDHYPAELTRIRYSEKLSAYCETHPFPVAYTQKLRVPASSRPGVGGEPSTSDGSFFSSTPIYLPAAGNFQVVVRYNDSSLETVQKAYRDLGHDVTLETAEEGMFRFRLTASYYDEETEQSALCTRDTTFTDEASVLFYHYVKLVFDDVPDELDGMQLRWMRVDVYLAGYEEVFCNLAVYETMTEISGVMVPVDVFAYHPGKEELPQ